MRIGVSAAILAASILAGGTASAACPPGQSRKCLDLDQVPQISQQIVAGEHIAVPPKTAPTAEPTPAYTGPTLGVSRTVRQAPTVGYHWAID
jgi:hypothetical protein